MVSNRRKNSGASVATSVQGRSKQQKASYAVKSLLEKWTTRWVFLGNARGTSGRFSEGKRKMLLFSK